MIKKWILIIFAQYKKKIIFHDLDHLSGTWTQKDKVEFEENTRFFEKIDGEIW